MLKSDQEIDPNAFVNQVSLDCLINKTQYQKCMINSIAKKINKKDKKFYRKRILNLTKELLISKEDDDDVNIFPDITYAFDNFIKTCIHYFKILDKNDIIQEDYKELNQEINQEIKELNETSEILKEENEILLMRSIKIANPSLDNFVKFTMIKTPEKIIIPKKKEINLKDPILKNKGIIKKKNIINKYDENEEKQKEKDENKQK